MASDHRSVATELLELGKRSIANSPLEFSISDECLSNQGRMSGTAQPNTLSTEDKKRLKRAANRRSAQLSRQRKKKFIEELTVEHSKLKQVTEILAAMSDIILMVDSSGNIIFASEAAHRVLQFSDGAFFGRNIYSLVADDSRRHLQEALQTAATDYKRRSAL